MANAILARPIRYLTAFQQRLVAAFERYPWIGWAAWLAFCIATYLRTNPHRFGPTFGRYLRAADHFFARQPVYYLDQLGDYLYWPVSLLPIAPLWRLEHATAAKIVVVVSMLLLTVAGIMLVRALFPERPTRETLNLAGILLMINIPAAWFNFKYVQASIAMTAAMMLATAAMARRQWIVGSFWLFVSVVVKPLSLVMLLLSGAARPRMRIALALALLAALLLPFAFGGFEYVTDVYRAWIIKLTVLTHGYLIEWPYQADFATMLDSFGFHLDSYSERFTRTFTMSVRVTAALVTLVMALRVAWTRQEPAVVALALAILSGCYITLFGQRNEFLSFIVLTPSLTALALVMLMRNAGDQRAWALIVTVLIMGFHVDLMVDRWTKPLLVTIIFGWLIWLTIKPARWRALFQPEASGLSSGSDRS